MVLLNAVMVSVTFMTLLERKVIAWAQSRLGPMRVGPYGVLQAIADPIKLILKEDITPAKADKVMFTLAPIMSLVPAFVVFAVIPFGSDPFYYVADINVFRKQLQLLDRRLPVITNHAFLTPGDAEFLAPIRQGLVASSLDKNLKFL